MNLGRYEVVRELGKGAMGVVYLARDPLIGRMVALKTIRLSDSGDEEEVREFQQRFMREAQAAGILSHPSIVTVHDIGQDAEKGVSFIAMEYVEGPTLKEIIQQPDPISHAELSNLLAQVAEALDYAHARGIVHRDVKPANIILPPGSGVKITDFGIAKIAAESANLTTTGQFLGTPNYMAPEQVKGAPVDGRTDIFSLGIVIYEGLTRRKPFGGDSLTTISYRIVHEPFEPPTQVDPAIPVQFDEVVRRCLAKEPKDRYARARDVAADLRAIAAGKPLVEHSLDSAAEPTLIGASPSATVEIPSPTLDRSSSRTAPRVPASLTRKVPTALFFSVIAILLVATAAVSGWLWSRQVPVPEVDERREAAVMRQRELRTEAMQMIEQGNVEGAYQRFQELKQLAPRSRGVDEMIARLEQIRGEQQSIAERLEEAAAKLAEGKEFFEKRQFERAIPLFEEAFNLDSTSTEAVNYLTMSREQLTLRQMREAEKMASQQLKAAASSGVAGSLAIEYQSSLDEGYVMIQVDGEKVLHENAYEETRRGLFRRRSPKPIRQSFDISAGRHEIVVWVIIPGMRITERKVFDAEVAPGAQKRISIVWNGSSKTFDIQLI
ncbi:MAG: protein kinase [Thermoanaerobaculia bacterium]